MFNRRNLLKAGVSTAALLGLSTSEALSFRRRTGARPNIIHLCADDMRFDDWNYMHNVKTLLRAKGLDFTHHFGAYTNCGPSRVSMLTGQYVHNHGVTDGQGDMTAWDKYKLQMANSIAPWMQAAGYYTGHIGKFINGYEETTIPPGYDQWHAMYASFEKFRNFRLNDNGVVTRYNLDPNGVPYYTTDLFTTLAIDFMTNAPPDQPFCLWYWPNSCHGPDTPDTQDVGTVDPADFAPPASFNVNIVNGKARKIGTPAQIAANANHWALRVENLQALDRSIAAVIAAAPANTILMFSSDNGFQLGEHCIFDNKGVLYNESARLPLTIIGPGVGHNGTSAVVSNIDHAPTMLDLGGGTATGRVLDGQSLVPIFAAGKVPNNWRRAALVECPFGNGIFTLHFAYNEWNKHFTELFDMDADPLQMTNVAGESNYASVRTACAAALHTLETCSGSTCDITTHLPGGVL